MLSSGCLVELEWPTNKQEDFRASRVVELSLCPDQWEWLWSSPLFSMDYLYHTAIYIYSFSTLAVLDIKKDLQWFSLAAPNTSVVKWFPGFSVWQSVQWPEMTSGSSHHSSIPSYSCCQTDKFLFGRPGKIKSLQELTCTSNITNPIMLCWDFGSSIMTGMFIEGCYHYMASFFMFIISSGKSWAEMDFY